jgi:nucleotide-binding universal stress UspA family protein
VSYDVVVAPTDGSNPAEAGPERAVELARALDANRSRPVRRRRIGADAGVAVERHLRRGRPAEAIVAFAAECDADLVVMGTQGRSGFDRIRHAGSTTERVLRSASVPVLAVPPAGSERS